MSWKVLITASAIGQVGQSAVAALQQAGCELRRVPPGGQLDGGNLPRLLEGCDAVLAGSEIYSPAILAATEAARLKIISRWGVGYDAIDVPAATGQGIAIAFTPGLTDEAVADYTFALLLALVRHVADGQRSLREGRWLPAWGNDLAGKTLGILGYGRIARAVTRRARGFDLKLIAHNPKPLVESGVEFVSFDELLARSDYLTLHTALKPQTRGLMGAAQLRKMKPTARLINTSRGPIIDETALARALQEGWIAGAALDVYSEEPLPANHPLRAVPNLLLSPHQASSSRETGERVSMAAAEAIIDLMQGRQPRLLVNPEVFISPKLRATLKAGDGKS